jgi:hypothetical protein
MYKQIFNTWPDLLPESWLQSCPKQEEIEISGSKRVPSSGPPPARPVAGRRDGAIQ